VQYQPGDREVPSRLLREGIIDSTAVNALSFPAEVFYRRLMSVVDDYGRFDGRPAVLRSRLYPLKVETVREADILRWIAECEKAELLSLYAVTGAGSSRWIATCEKAGLAVSGLDKVYVLFHKLGPARAKESKFPPPPDANTHPFTSENGCAQPQTDENGCAHVRPYSGSDSGTDSDSGSGTRPAAVADDRFERFWEAYPRKEKKADAVKAFAKLDPDPPLFAAILAAVETQKRPGGALEMRFAEDGRCTVPHPTSWLNGKRWEDEPPPPPNGTHPPAGPKKSAAQQRVDAELERLQQEAPSG
jgi:hypothetical protein